MALRIVYLATADARGHLMRAQLLVHALRAAGATVEALTTADAGRDFLLAFGIDAPILSRHYAVQFDTRQNMLREATDRNVAHYVFRPSRMLRDIAQLRPLLRRADLIINDSFHPALLVMGALPGWRRKVVHVYGGSLRQALVDNFAGRLPRLAARAFGAIIGSMIEAARGSIEHDFASDFTTESATNSATAAQARRYRLPTPIPVIGEPPPGGAADAAIYLNPHFRDAALAHALSAGLDAAGLTAHRVGEGYAGDGLAGWVGVDEDWATKAAHAKLLVSAPGMAALSIAQVYQRPILLVLTDQPEQAANAARAAQLGLKHRAVIWRGDGAQFEAQVKEAAADLTRDAARQAPAAEGRERAQMRVEAWVERIFALGADAPPPAANRLRERQPS